jgi:large subunit ribosomal protein L29
MAKAKAKKKAPARKAAARRPAAKKTRAAKKTTRAKRTTHELKGHSAAAELRSKSAEQLADELLKLRKEQFALRMQRATGQAVKPDQFGKVRRSIARLKTVQREAQLRAAAGESK